MEETKKRKKTGGRQKGVRNKTTDAAKRVLVKFVDKNMEEMQEMFDEIKQEDRKAAFNILFDALEYCLPKLSRVEVKDDDDQHEDRVRLMLEAMDDKQKNTSD